MIRLFHTKIGFYRIYPSGFYVDPFYCLVLNVYGLYMAVKVQNYCLESDFYPFFIYLHYLKSG